MAKLRIFGQERCSTAPPNYNWRVTPTPSGEDYKRSPFHVMAKPVGPICNLNCRYCFYLEKEKLFPATETFRMPDAVLERLIRQQIELTPGAEVSFAWQGGEPTLLGVPYFEKIVALQRRFSGGRTIVNAIQTNGTLLDDQWGEFLAREKFLVGISIDGPRALHDAYRIDKRNQPTFDAVMSGVKVLRTHAVEFNTLTVVNRKNVQEPLAVYQFLKDIGSRFIQFIPLVERNADAAMKASGFDWAPPPQGSATPPGTVTPWSVPADAYGEFLVEIFDEWVRRDVGRIFVQLFDVALGNWMNVGSVLCVFSETCGRALAIEHNGDLYACDHYVYPQFKLGNILNQSLGDMVNSEQQIRFGQSKSASLPRYCRECSVRFACHGECPKHRFIKTPHGEPGLNYLCRAYKRFFTHIDPWMKKMAELVRMGLPAANVLERQAGRSVHEGLAD